MSFEVIIRHSTQGGNLRIFLSIVVALLKALLWTIPLALIAIALVWFFGDIILGYHVDILIAVRKLYIGLYLLDVLSNAIRLLYYIRVAKRVNASYADVWEAAHVYRMDTRHYKDPYSFHSDLSLARGARKISDATMRTA